MSQVETSTNCRVCLTSREISEGLVGRAHIGFADDFDQRRPAAVQIDVGIAVGIAEALVLALARVVFHMHAGDADALAAPSTRYQPSHAPPAARHIARSDSPWAIRIEVVLAREARQRAESAVQRHRAFHREFHRFAAQDRQRAGQSEAHRTDVGIRSRAETGRASAENLGARASWTCTSSPITGSYFAISSGGARCISIVDISFRITAQPLRREDGSRAFMRRIILIVLAFIIAGAGGVCAIFVRDLKRARARLASRSQTVETDWARWSTP